MARFTAARERYLSFYGAEPCPLGEIVAIEERLSINLPEDFKRVSTFYSGGLLGGISHFSIGGEDEFSVVGETLRLRHAIGLRDKFVALAEPAGSLIVLDVAKIPAVVWCDALDVEGLGANDSLTFIDAWDTYEDFFLYLLQQEGVERGLSE